MAEQGQQAGQQFYLEISIGENSFNSSNIEYLVIKEWIFNIIPTIEFQIADPEGILIDGAPLEDESEIEVILAKSEDDPNPIEMTFLMDDYTVSIVGDNRLAHVTITGHLKVDDMFETKSRSFSKRNSTTLLKQIASEAGLTFSNPHNVVASDNMTWLQAVQNNYDFINHVLQRAYIPNDTLFFFGTRSNEFVLTSLLAEIDKKDVKKAKFSVENFESFVKNDDDPDDTIWFSSYNIVNYSGYFNKKVGYGFGYSYYDLNGKLVAKEYDQIEKLTDLSFRNKKKVGTISNYNDYIQDYVESNLYSEKYFESLSRNKFLTSNFFANSVVLNVNSLSQVNLMDTIDVDIPSLLEAEQSNLPMSGFYLVAGIQHEVSKGGLYIKKLALGRNGMNKSPNVKHYEVEES